MGLSTAVSKDVACSVIPPKSKVIDLSAQTFGRLTVRGFFGFDPGGRALWVCDCGCGNTTIARSSTLRRGHKESCGCLVGLVNGTLMRVHGEGHPDERSPEFRAWCGMSDRCYNARDPHYPDYGGRGIRVSLRWKSGEGDKSGFQCFLDDMGRRPTPKHSLDRYPDVNGNYETSNCRWATPKQQQRNRRVTIMVEHCGARQSLAELCENNGTSYEIGYLRYKRGKSPEEIVAPVRRRP